MSHFVLNRNSSKLTVLCTDRRLAPTFSFSSTIISIADIANLLCFNKVVRFILLHCISPSNFPLTFWKIISFNLLLNRILGSLNHCKFHLEINMKDQRLQIVDIELVASFKPYKTPVS